MANSAGPDQLASSEANWSGFTLFAKARVKKKISHFVDGIYGKHTDFKINSKWYFTCSPKKQRNMDDSVPRIPSGSNASTVW